MGRHEGASRGVKSGGWNVYLFNLEEGQAGGQGPPGATSQHPSLAGEYVIMVRDVTTPPFLGCVLPTAFKHLRVSAEGAWPRPHIPGEGPGTPS